MVNNPCACKTCSFMKIYIVANTTNQKEIFGGSLNPFKAQRIAQTQSEFGIPCDVLCVSWFSLSYSLREALRPAIKAEQAQMQKPSEVVISKYDHIIYRKRDHVAYAIPNAAYTKYESLFKNLKK